MDWDETKRRSNLAKHGLDFRDFERFDWDSAVFRETQVVEGELREQVLGLLDGQLVFVVYTERGGETRVISMRRPNRSEARGWYDEQG